MYSRTYNLCIALGEKSDINEDLIISNSLYKLDQYISKMYKSHEDVRNEFDQIIGEFCLSNMKKIQYEDKKNNTNRRGDIVILEKQYDENGHLINTRKIKIIYKNHYLLDRQKCISQIKEVLKNDEELFKLRKNKDYLLTDEEKEAIDIYATGNAIKEKEKAINSFTKRIAEEKSVDAYYHCRNLVNLCNLMGNCITIEKGNIKNINASFPKKNSLQFNCEKYENPLANDYKIISGIKNYHEIEKISARKNFFAALFNIAFSENEIKDTEIKNKILYSEKYKNKDKYSAIRNYKLFLFIKKFEKYGYYISSNEKYYLTCFYENLNYESEKEKFKKKFLALLNINLKTEFTQEESQKKEDKNQDESRYELNVNDLENDDLKVQEKKRGM